MICGAYTTYLFVAAEIRQEEQLWKLPHHRNYPAQAWLGLGWAYVAYAWMMLNNGAGDTQILWVGVASRVFDFLAR